MPKSKDTTAGFYRRWLILSFDKPIKSEEKIRNYGEMIVAEEREGIMAWAASCIKELNKKGDYTIPKSHERELDKLMGENDSVYFYMKSDEGPKKKEGCKMTIMDIYEKYTSFCYATSKCKPVGLRMFLAKMTELGVFMGFEVEGLQVIGLSV
jgi:phage/plasmid-associated DNA primase